LQAQTLGYLLPSSSTGSWQYVESYITTGTTTTAVEFLIRTRGPGTFYWDDLSLAG
jgi:hypothetical protein